MEDVKKLLWKNVILATNAQKAIQDIKKKKIF
jgi:hypothetical protein